MNASEKAALIDFVHSVIWPGRTVRTTTAAEDDFTLTSAWNVTYDIPMVWVDGNRYTGAVTWNSTTSIHTATEIPAGSLVVILISPGSGANYLARTPGVAGMNGNLPMGSNRITGLGASVDPSDAVRRDEVEQIATELIGANYALLSGAAFSGPITVQAATADANPVRKDQAVLLNGTQPSTALQSYATELTPTDNKHWVPKKYVDDLITAISASAYPPNRMAEYLTPGIFSFTAVVGRKYWFEIASGAGASGGTGINGYASGAGAPGLVRAVAFVAASTTIAVEVGGGGYGGSGNGGSGIGGAGGGGGGSASRVSDGTNSVTLGGGGGGGGSHSEGSGTAGNGGAGGTAGQSGASSGGAAGTLGAGSTNGGTGGTGGGSGSAGTAGTSGTATSSPSSILSTYDETWAFNVRSAPSGGAAIPDTDTNTNGIAGAHGSIRIRWYEA